MNSYAHGTARRLCTCLCILSIAALCGNWESNKINIAPALLPLTFHAQFVMRNCINSYPSSHSSMYYRSVHPSMHLFTHPSIHASINHLSIHAVSYSVHTSIHPSMCVSMHHVSIPICWLYASLDHLSIHACGLHAYIYSSIHVCIHPSCIHLIYWFYESIDSCI